MSHVPIDDLLDELYPAGEKPLERKSSWDEPATTNAGSKPAPQEQQPEPARKPAPKPSAPPVAAPAPMSQGGGFDDSDEDDGGAQKSRRAAPWPVIPHEDLRGGRRCPARTARLTSYMSAKAMAQQHRRLFPASPAGRVARSPAAPTAGQSAGALNGNASDDDGSRYCPYLQCLKCDYAVVSLPNAYWSNQTAAKQPSPAPPAASSSAPPKAAESDNWDDSDDDAGEAPQPSTQNGQQGAPSAPGGVPTTRTAEDMYMLMRYHYPDFGAFPPGVVVRLSNDVAAAGAASMAYCCQCTWVSATDAVVTVGSGGEQGEQSAALHPALATLPLPSSAPMNKVEWECKGHSHQ
jgi:hypothetical protein